MKIKIISVFLIIFFILSSYYVGATVVTNKTLDINESENNYLTKPDWAIGNYWKYDMDFIFTVKDGNKVKFSVDASISNLYATVTSISEDNGTDVYVLTLDGEISGVITLFSAEIEVGSFSGELIGDAIIGKDTLGIKKFLFEVTGEVSTIIGSRSLFFEMIMTFDKCFDFFDFPIYDDEPDWDVKIDEAYMYSHVIIDVPFGEADFESSMMFNDVMSINGTEAVDVPAGIFDSIILSGTWGQLSKLWYAHEVGYLAKVKETLNWEDGEIVSEFNLNLLETNYDACNVAPNKPDKAYGIVDGEVDKTYSYSTQTTDPDGDLVSYFFDWGDNTNSGWTNYAPSGNSITLSHIWYSKGIYNVIVKAKDENEIESDWSEPLSVSIKGDPKVFVNMYKIEKLDEIEWDPTGQNMKPEWYYKLAVDCDGVGSPPVTVYNTDNGKYTGNWYSKNVWEPNNEHVFTVSTNNPVIKIKLMDYDDFWEGGDDDLADISGCDVPDTDGRDDNTDDKRGAMYHGTYDLVTNKLKGYNTGDPAENADYYYRQDGYYITSGDYQPDDSTRYEHGMTDPENDAVVWFKLDNDYTSPQAFAQVLDITGKIRPFDEVNFAGTVSNGAPPYSWRWDFDDGIIKNVQNPTHVFENKGNYNVKLTITDGFEQTSTYELTVKVENTNPILSKDKVEYTGKGTTADTFTFKVHYIDPDLDEPSVKKVYIDNTAKNLNGFGSNADYSLELTGSEIGQGNHKYYFYFEDGHGGSTQTSEKSFSVTKSRSRFIEKFVLTRIFEVFPILSKLFKILAI